MSDALFQAAFTVDTTNGSGPTWTVEGDISDLLGAWTASSIQVNDLIFDEDTFFSIGTVNCWRVTNIVSAVGSRAVLDVVYNEDTPPGPAGYGAPVTGPAAICRSLGSKYISQCPAPEWTNLSRTIVNAALNYDRRVIAPAIANAGLLYANAAGALPVDSDVAAWPTANASGIVKCTDGSIYLAFKNVTDVYFVSLTAI